MRQTFETARSTRTRRQVSSLLGGAAVAVLLTMSALPSNSSDEEIVVSHGISTFGELKYPADFMHFDYVNPDAPKGGRISVWGFGTFDSFNPYIVKGNAEWYSSIMYESLMARSYDEPDSYYGLLAESVTYPKDSRQWVEFKMRPEARFSDGSPVTAHDVVFSFEQLSKKGTPAILIPLQSVASAEALDDLRVRFTFKDGVPTRSLPLEVAQMPVFARSHFQDREFEDSDIEPPLVSGAYVLESVSPGQKAVYVKDDDYWGESLPYNVGSNNFERIVVEYYADFTSAHEGFKGGSYDLRREYWSKLWATGYEFPDVLEGKVLLEEIPDRNPSGAQGFWLNLRRDVFNDPKVRKAIGLAFNFEWSNQSLFYGLYRRTDSFWENSVLQAEGMPSSEELELLEPLRGVVPETVFTEPAYSPPTSDPDRLADRNVLGMASELLDEAGWELVEGVRRNAGGRVLEFEILTDGPSFDRIVIPFVENLEQIGVKATIRRLDHAQLELREDSFDYDVTTRAFSFGLTPGADIRAVFGSDSANSPGSNNMSGVANPGVDALLETIANASTRAELEVAVRALDRVLRAMHIWVPQWYGGTHRVAYRNKYSRPTEQAPYTLGELTLWWYDEERARGSGNLE